MRAVLETPFSAPDAAPWPVTTLEPGAWLTLDGTCGDPEVGLFVATVADYNDLPPDALATAEHLIAPGGLILADTTTEIVPGCRPREGGSAELGPDDVEDVRESSRFFAAVTAVREALRKGHG